MICPFCGTKFELGEPEHAVAEWLEEQVYMKECPSCGGIVFGCVGVDINRDVEVKHETQ